MTDDLRRTTRPGRGALALGLVLIVWLVLPSVAQAQTVTLDPTSGPGGTTVTVEGFGFQPNEVVEVSFAGQSLGVTEADPEGFARITGTIPDGVPAGSHPLDVTGSMGSSSQFSFEVTEVAVAEPSPSEDSGQNEGSPQDGGTATDDGATIDEGGTAGGDTLVDDDSGSSTALGLFIGILVVLFAGLMFMPAGRGPIPTLLLFGLFGSIWDWIFGKKPSGPVQIGPCPHNHWVRTAAGSRISIKAVERSGDGSNCVWTVTMVELNYWFNSGYECTLYIGHPEAHLLAATPTLRDPAAPVNNIEIVREWELEIPDPNCTMGEGLVRDEAQRRYARGPARVAVGTGGGSGGSQPLNLAPCKVCGEPRGNQSPCPHCGMD